VTCIFLTHAYTQTNTYTHTHTVSLFIRVSLFHLGVAGDEHSRTSDDERDDEKW
jgi:hypothetical protein